MGNTFYHRPTILKFGTIFSNTVITMKIKIVLLFSILLGTCTVQAQRSIRIGYIDMDYILENVPEYKQASAQLEGKVQKWKAEIELKLSEVETMKKSLENERPLLTKELIEEKEEEIKFEEEQIIALKQQRFGPSGDLMTQKRQLVQPVQDQVFTAVQEIATNRNYDFVFDKSADVVMLYSAERHNISDQVIRSITRASKREQITSKEEKEEFLEEENRSVEEDAAVSDRKAAIEAKKKEREDLIAQRKRERDSLRAARQREYEERRQKALEERQRKKDSIAEARNNTGKNTPPSAPETNNDQAVPNEE